MGKIKRILVGTVAVVGILGVSTMVYGRYKWEGIDTIEDAGYERPDSFGVDPVDTSDDNSSSDDSITSTTPPTVVDVDGKDIEQVPVVEIEEARELETFLLWSVGSNGVTDEQASALGTRSGGDGLADVVMLVMSNGKEASILRIPRDTWLDNKLSEIPNLHGPGVMEARIEALTGVEVDHVATGDFWAVASLVDEVGGVDVYIKEDITSNGTMLYEGGMIHHMDGAEAVRFSRLRKIQVGGNGGNDFDRIRNQGTVIEALMQNKSGLISNFNNLFDALEGHVLISDSLNPELLFSHLNANIISTVTMEGLDFGWVGKKSVLTVTDPDAVRKQIEAMVAELNS